MTSKSIFRLNKYNINTYMTYSLSAISFLNTIEPQNKNIPLKSIQKKYQLSPIYQESKNIIEGYIYIYIYVRDAQFGNLFEVRLFKIMKNLFLIPSLISKILYRNITCIFPTSVLAYIENIISCEARS